MLLSRLEAVELNMLFMTLRKVHLSSAVALGGILLWASSFAGPSPTIYGAKQVGDYLPQVKITNECETGQAPLASNEHAQDLRLVHFWAAYDAESRAENVAFEAYRRAHPELGYQAISLDLDPRVYQATIAFDGVGTSPSQVLVDSARRSGLIELSGLGEALHSYLVDAEGKILSVDPTTKELDKFVRS